MVATARHPRGLRRARRAPERRQVDARQRHGRAQGGDRLGQAPDDAAGDPRGGHPDDTQLVLVDLPGRPAPARRADRAHAAPRRVRDGGVRRRAASSSTPSRASAPGDRFIAGALRGAGVPVVLAVNKIDRLDRAHTLAALSDGRGARRRRRDLPGQRAHRPRRRGAARPPGRAHAREPLPLRRRGPLRPAARGAAGRARARAGAAPHLPGGAARRRGRDRRGAGARGWPDLRARARVGRGGVPEGDPHRRPAGG